MGFDVAGWWTEWGGNLIHAGIIVVLGFAAVLLVQKLTNRMLKLAETREDSRAAKREKTLSVFLRSVARAVIIGLVLVLILGEFGVEIGPIIAAAGVAGIAIGFGAQTLVQDFLGGTFLLTEGYARVGDVIEVNGKSGVVEDISLRLLVMRDFGGNVIVIPNGEIRTFTNMTYRYSRALIEVGVAYREDSDRVVAIMEEVGRELAEEMREVIESGPEIFGINEFGDSAVSWQVRFQTKPIEQWNVERAYRRRLKARFDEAGIEIPFPHRTVYWGENHEGESPFMHMKLYQPDGESIVTESNGGSKNPAAGDGGAGRKVPAEPAKSRADSTKQQEPREYGDSEPPERKEETSK